MSEIDTTTEFGGNTAELVIISAICLPLGLLMYFNQQEERWICPECRKTVDAGASTCYYCDEDLDQYD